MPRFAQNAFFRYPARKPDAASEWPAMDLRPERAQPAPLTTPRDSPVSIFGQGADGQRNGHSLSHHSRCFRTQRSKFHNCCIAAPLMSRLPQQGGATRSIQALSLPNIFRVRLTIFHNGKGY
jgi:hypothetical protein